jgi:hypothetical protein
MTLADRQLAADFLQTYFAPIWQDYPKAWLISSNSSS